MNTLHHVTRFVISVDDPADVLDALQKTMDVAGPDPSDNFGHRFARLSGYDIAGPRGSPAIVTLQFETCPFWRLPTYTRLVKDWREIFGFSLQRPDETI